MPSPYACSSQIFLGTSSPSPQAGFLDAPPPFRRCLHPHTFHLVGGGGCGGGGGGGRARRERGAVTIDRYSNLASSDSFFFFFSLFFFFCIPHFFVRKDQAGLRSCSATLPASISVTISRSPEYSIPPDWLGGMGDGWHGWMDGWLAGSWLAGSRSCSLFSAEHHQANTTAAGSVMAVEGRRRRRR